jgi:serine/threonine-protein kinase HipA
MHLKNFSLIHRDNSIDFSPAYDLINVNLVFPKDQEETALLLNGRKKNIHLRDFEALGTVLGIPGKVRDNSYKKFRNHNPVVREMIQASFLPPDMQDTFWQIWNKKQQIFTDLIR